MSSKTEFFKYYINACQRYKEANAGFMTLATFLGGISATILASQWDTKDFYTPLLLLLVAVATFSFFAAILLAILSNIYLNRYIASVMLFQKREDLFLLLGKTYTPGATMRNLVQFLCVIGVASASLFLFFKLMSLNGVLAVLLLCMAGSFAVLASRYSRTNRDVLLAAAQEYYATLAQTDKPKKSTSLATTATTPAPASVSRDLSGEVLLPPDEKTSAAVAPHTPALPQATEAQPVQPDQQQPSTAKTYYLQQYLVKEKWQDTGYGSLFKAIDTQSQQPVVIKILSEELSHNLRFVEFIKRKVLLHTKTFRHPNWVTLYEAGEFKGRAYYVMEYIDGVSLQQIVQQQQHYTQEQALRVMLQLLQAIIYARKYTPIDYCFRPDNIVITKASVVKILDIGIHNYRDQIKQMTVTGTATNIHPYFCPEQLHEALTTLDDRMLCFCLGSICYYMLTGNAPFSGENTLSISLGVLQKQPAPIASVNRDVSAELQEIVCKMMAKKPEERYPSLAAVLGLLQNLGHQTREIVIEDVSSEGIQ